MEDETVCPLCCEELDISDQQFFPCKCGYQVCMWCWHRIRESESGLCPACRTPYGDDPHEFSAVDVAEVLKANKAKAAAEKRERERLRAAAEAQHLESDDGNAPSGTTIGQMDVPKDRSQLANMRVIRRNLVYAVGLPPSIANEETLRKPEYFGQYGKIAKIVLNRTNVTSSDPRRASASAYVTFVHKNDTLACVLALDGFFMDGRNIRASYGTSKYCSAFIKNVRCNNPDCTYLHGMGEAEDTFTKQEIQAGYVTSGRDVLLRQQQIVAEQLSAAGVSSGAARRKTGGGGPSGTGKAAVNPVFPPPQYDEPLRLQSAMTTTTTSTPLVAPPATITRSKSVSSAATAPVASSIPAAAKMNRSASVSAASPVVSSNKTAVPVGGGLTGATAASVVAGMHSIGNAAEPPAAHTTLTPLTPLKRASKSKSHGEQRENAPKLSTLRSGSQRSQKNGLYGVAPPSPSSSSVSSVGNKSATHNNTNFSVGSIGGTALGPPGTSAVGGSLIGASSSSSIGNQPIGGNLSFGGGGSSALGGQPIGLNEPIATSSSLGGEIFTGSLAPRKESAIGSHNDKWNSAAPGDRGNGGLFGNSSGSLGGIGGGDIWGKDSGGGMPVGSGRSAGVIGGNSGSIGTIGHGGGDVSIGSGGGFGANSGSSALASMLGINLPTGSGSLRESSGLWNGPSTSQVQSSVSSLNGTSAPGVIGASNRAPGSGMPIGGSSGLSGGGGLRSGVSTPGGSGGSSSDIALLQSLLPGVHITSGNAEQPAAPAGAPSSAGGWNSASMGQPMSNAGVGFGMAGPPQGDSWGGAPIGGGSGISGAQGRQQQQNHQSRIW